MNTIQTREQNIQKIISQSSSNSKMIEVTPTVGCAVACSYCPQTLLINNYRKTSTRSSTPIHMTPEVYIKLLNNCPADIHILWTGYVEPLTSPNIIELLKIGAKRGLTQGLSTTLYRASKEQVLTARATCNSLYLHLQDTQEQMGIIVNDEYLNMIEFTVSNMNTSSDLVQFIGKPHQKIVDLFNVSQKILQKRRDGLKVLSNDATSRAGNLEGHPLSESLRKLPRYGLYKCERKKFNRPVVLPDGRLAICCMDYGLEEIHGNLLENSLNELLENGTKRVAEKILNKVPNLCSKCDWLVPAS